MKENQFRDELAKDGFPDLVMEERDANGNLGFIHIRLKPKHLS